jgi:hypothetical protein
MIIDVNQWGNTDPDAASHHGEHYHGILRSDLQTALLLGYRKRRQEVGPHEVWLRNDVNKVRQLRRDLNPDSGVIFSAKHRTLSTSTILVT